MAITVTEKQWFVRYNADRSNVGYFMVSCGALQF